ncbi:MAG TPA: hypothetical protein VE011_04615 [Candidatus Dormibacteraeota bacterium]|nr:hypothetical protein [Candidatus Dormibacteraeota bacterium]
MRDRTRVVVAAVLGLVGLVWLAQGLGYLPGSFMTGDRFWAYVGAALLVGAFVYAAWPRLRHR